MLSAFSASYGMLMISRIGVACTHSVFWSIASPTAVSVVSEKFRSMALSMVVTGTSIAMILGLPLGRSFGAVSVTGHDSYREPFEPVVPGVRFAEFNDLDSVKALVNDKTCAIILEPLQGEGGINLATQEFMEGIRKICDENGILMICDEVQCGMGRTGNMFAWQGFGVKPDILTMAKAIGNGIPVGAFAMTEEVAKYSLQPGDHGATYGGNPLACTAVKKVIEIFEREDIVGHVNQVAPYLTKKLDELVDELDCVVKRKGKGLMQGIEITKPLADSW